ncbi:MAG: head GIN domain-containing protein [Myxococcota bacterium]
MSNTGGMAKLGISALMFGLVVSAGCHPSSKALRPGAGPIVQQDREVAAFDSVSLRGTYEAQVEVGAEQRVTLEGELDRIAEIETTVEDGELRVRFPKGISFRNDGGIRLVIVSPHLTAIETDGATQLDVTGLRGASFDLEVNGSTQAHLDGEITALNAEVNGAGDLDSTDLLAQSVAIEVNGTGQADVTALASLDAEINGAGRVRYRGEPKVAKAVHGVGRVRPF